MVFESQQAVGNALLVARKTHSDPFDVTVGKEEERESQGQGWEAEAERKIGQRGGFEDLLKVRESSYGGGWRVRILTGPATEN